MRPHEGRLYELSCTQAQYAARINQIGVINAVELENPLHSQPITLSYRPQGVARTHNVPHRYLRLRGRNTNLLAWKYLIGERKAVVTGNVIDGRAEMLGDSP